MSERPDIEAIKMLAGEAEAPTDDDVYGSDDPIKSLRGAWKAYLAADGPLDPNDPQKGVRTTAELRYATRWGMQPLLDRLDAAEARGSRLEAVVEAARANRVRFRCLASGPGITRPRKRFSTCLSRGDEQRCSACRFEAALASLDTSVVVPDAPEEGQ